MAKRRSVKEAMEEVIKKDPHREYSFIKVPGQEPVEVTGKYTATSVYRDMAKCSDAMYDYLKDKTDLKRTERAMHNHPAGTSTIPSAQDLRTLLENPGAKSETIVIPDGQGSIEGSLTLQKGKKTPDFPSYKWVDELTELYQGFAKIGLARPALYLFSKIYGLKYKIIPAKGYRYNSLSNRKPSFVKITGEDKKRTNLRGLEKSVSTTAMIIGIAGGIFFLSSNLTGNVIGNTTNSSSNILGVCFLIIGLIAGFFWMRSRR